MDVESIGRGRSRRRAPSPDVGASHRSVTMPNEWRAQAGVVVVPRRDDEENALTIIIDAMREGGGRQGAAKIVLPRAHAFGFDVDLRTWRFRARIQAVRALGAMKRATEAIRNDQEENFRDAYESFAGECAANGETMKAPRGAAWRVHALRGWRFDLRALYEEVTAKGGFDAIDSNQTWRDVAERLGAHGQGCAAGHAVKVLYRDWLLDFERVKRARDVAKNAAKFQACAHELDREDKDVIDALVGLELGASGAPPQRPKLENVRLDWA